MILRELRVPEQRACLARGTRIINMRVLRLLCRLRIPVRHRRAGLEQREQIRTNAHRRLNAVRARLGGGDVPRRTARSGRADLLAICLWRSTLNSVRGGPGVVALDWILLAGIDIDAHLEVGVGVEVCLATSAVGVAVAD